MKKFLLYFLTAIIATLLAFLVNQLPTIPDPYKPWVPSGVFILTIVSAVLLIKQNQDSGLSSQETSSKVLDSEQNPENILAQKNSGGTNFQTQIEGGEVYQGNITINKNI
jgi:hypothetical protein